MNPGQTLAIIRTIRGINQAEIAARLGLQRTAISMMENGSRQIRADHRDKLRAIGIDVDDPAITAAITQLREAICGHAQPS